MKNTNFFNTAFSLLFVLVLFSATALAQSTDPDSPTMVTQSVIQWNNPGTTKTAVYYYAFTAGPGVLKITTDQKSNGITANTKLEWELTDADFKKLASEDFYQVTTSERRVTDIKLTKKQKVILKVTAVSDVVNFKLQLAGAVSFAPVKSGGDEDIPEITGDDSTTSTQQICMPRNGVLIMTMKDGKKAKIDLSKVQKIEVQ